MNYKELIALRTMFFLTVPEAAELIGERSERLWRYWESNKRPIPESIKLKMNALIEKRHLMIESVEQVIKEKQADKVELEYCLTFKEYKARHEGSTRLNWRMAQSVAVHFLMLKKVSLV